MQPVRGYIESPLAHWLRRARKPGSPQFAARIFNLILITSVNFMHIISPDHTEYHYTKHNSGNYAGKVT